MKNGEGIYTITRSKEDVKKLEKLKDLLNKDREIYVTDSSVYRDLPDLYLNAVETAEQLQQEIYTLTAKVAEFEEIQAHINGILEICKEKKGKKCNY